ncbi:hypothetical protein SAPIO_CDS4070 [Scedosporium apiospermum]|uniref:Aminoglycoside phosphotransferase domain-containing protein n=1 Tax=Pseudallescheria apiosperma TaxID=563466 RepID=A0A084G983_PSEDA|nr:uncharacterized protein SAPIO_CDS4070 [Scedosporium apiospermum]KEZ43895.1 hypothetical protein SAPIO_CDS4070 [Scedosporium apiospermum]
MLRMFFGKGFCLGFMAGVAAIFLAPHLLLDLSILSTARTRSGIMQHLDSREWLQRGREVTDDELSQGGDLTGHTHSKRKILKIDSTTVVKLSPNLDMAEVDNLVFIRSHTTIPVPRVLNAYEKEGCRYIVMEFIDGENLKGVWPKLSVEDRESICSELHEYLFQMRNIPAPEALIGSVSGGPAPVHQDIYEAMHRTDHEIVFSHGDLAFHNILVRDGHIAAILDWEYAGWYPEHWDFCQSLQFFGGIDEHYQFAKKAFGKTYLSEALMDMWFTRGVKHGGW